MKYSIKIMLEKRKNSEGILITNRVPIYASITFSGKRIFYFTGLRIDANQFDPEKQEVKKNNFGWEGKNKVQYNVMNDRFNAIKATCVLHFSNINSSSKEEIINKLDAVCKKAQKSKFRNDEMDFFPLWERYIKEARVKQGTRKQLQSTLNHWKRFSEQRKASISFENLDSSILRDFERFLQTDKIPKGRNSIHSRLKMTRTFLNYAKKIYKAHGKDFVDPFDDESYSLPGEVYGTPVYINLDELNYLFEVEIADEKLSRVRDLFVFQSLVGARVGDFIQLKTENVIDGVLSYIPEKTANDKPVTINIPLNSKAMEIISKYDLPDGRLLPFISEQKYNMYIKELFKRTGITRKVTILDQLTGKQKQVGINEIASSHMARRIFVGNLYGKIDEGIIKSMTGHSENSRAFTRYRAVTDELKKNAVDLL